MAAAVITDIGAGARVIAAEAPHAVAHRIVLRLVGDDGAEQHPAENAGGQVDEIRINGEPMGSTVSRPIEAQAVVRGAAGDVLVWVDTNGKFAGREIPSDDWRCELGLLGGAKRFVRAEIVASASRQRLVEEFVAEFEGKSLPWQLTPAQLASEPIRRAISNPVYIE